MKTKTLKLLLVCLCAQFTVTLSAVEIRTGDRQSEAAELARQADTKLQQSSSQQDFQEAAALLEKAVMLDPENLEARQTLGWVYLDRLHEPHKAYRHLAKVAKGRPENVDARKLFGLACSQTGHSRKAVEEFRAASQLEPNDLWIRAQLARSLARTGKLGEANTIYAEILKADPTNTDARLGEAEIDAWRGHSSGPLATLDQLAGESGTNTEVLILRGDIHRWNWDLAEARQDYQQVLNSDENNYLAKQGLHEAEKMGASSVGAKIYLFEDTSDFLRESAEVNTRVHVTDRAYILGRVAGWRFKNPGFSDLDRLDAAAGLEYHFARWLEMSAEANYFDYDNRDAFIGGKFSTKISPVTGTDIYANAAYNQPFVSSISTVRRGMREDSIGLGLDTKLVGRFSFQTAAQLAKLSDHNKWWDVRPQVSYRLFDKPATFLRAEYEYLNYEKSKDDYWTPHNRHTLGPVLDTSIPICPHFHFDASAKAPYAFDQRKFGIQAEGGPVVDLFNHMQLKGTVYYSEVPGDEGAWSGHGGQVALQVRF